MQCSAVQCSAVKCSPVHCAAVQCGVVWRTAKRPNRTSDINDPRNGQDRNEQVVENVEKGDAGGVDDTAGEGGVVGARYKGGVVGARCTPRKSDGSVGHAQMHHEADASLGHGRHTCLAWQETRPKKAVCRIPKEPRKVSPNAQPGDKKGEARGLLTCEGDTLTCEGDTLAQHRRPGQKNRGRRARPQ